MPQNEHRRDATVVGWTSLLIVLSIALLIVAFSVDAMAQKSAEPPTRAALPSIESIDADTDITVFLRTGVPQEMTIAALRRVWSADPAIRDFKGLAELDWDLTETGDDVFGFGPLDPAFDVEPMLEALFSRPVPTRVLVAQQPADRLSYLSSQSQARELAHE